MYDLSPGNTYHHQGPITFSYIPCECSGSLGRCYEWVRYVCRSSNCPSSSRSLSSWGISLWSVSHLVGNTGIFCSMSWSGCGRILTGIVSGQSTSTSHCNKAGASRSLDFSKDCCVILADPCVSWCSWVGSPSSISGLKSGASICITSPVFIC